MTTRAYDELYLAGAKRRLGNAMSYAANECDVPADDFAEAFVATGFARRFGEGNPWVVAGMSGIELAKRVIEESRVADLMPEPHHAQSRTPEHWAGAVLARLQWQMALPFDWLLGLVPPSQVVALYALHHEMPEARTIEELEARVERASAEETALGRIRRSCGLSQARLAELSAVGLRSIRAYEQRENDIARAQAGTLQSLSRVLGCAIEDLLVP